MDDSAYFTMTQRVLDRDESTTEKWQLNHNFQIVLLGGWTTQEEPFFRTQTDFVGQCFV